MRNANSRLCRSAASGAAQLRGVIFSLAVSSVFLFTACYHYTSPASFALQTHKYGFYHQVARGETLFSIGKLYGRDINLIAQLNTIVDPTALRPGTRIFIPPSDFYPSYASAPPVPKNIQAPAQQPRDTARATPSKPEDDTLKRASKLKWEIKPDRASPTVIASAKDYGEIDGSGKKTPRSADTPVFILPAQGKITRRFSNDKHDLHKGVDIAAPEGSKVVAARAGRVIWSRNKMPGYGNLIIIDHGEGFATVYGHNAKTLVHEDQYVQQGETIATVGKTGKASGPHVHFEIRKNTICVDPLDYVR